ncbi:restriction endonuclease subunit S [bacterium]|nr:restriction endonuclease subunit S [bacterium]
MSGLPRGWIDSTLGQLFTITLGQSPPSSTYNNDGIGLPFFQGKAEFGELYPSVRKWCSEPKKIAEKDAVLISVRAPVGPTNLAPENCCIGRGLAAINPVEGQNPRFILYQLRLIEPKLNDKGTGTTFRAITGAELKKIPFLLPLPPEQKRIVAKIEELFTKLDAGVKALQKAKALLKQYRQSVLKAAVEGRLTEEWRKEHAGEIEPASVFLERIQAERKQRLGSKYKTPKPVDTSNLPELPDGWVWATIDHISNKITDGEHLRPKMVQEGIAFVSAKDVRNHGVVFEETLFVSEEDAIKFRQRCNPKTNDVLIVSRGATVGRSCIVNTDRIFCLLGSVILIKPHSDIVPEYLSIAIKSPSIQKELIELSGSTAQQAIYIRDIRNQLVPIPLCAEQEIIAQEVARLTSIIDESEQTIDAELKRSQSLRQSILKRAFEGKLVPQDPADEPASVLLERIKKEKRNGQ